MIGNFQTSKRLNVREREYRCLCSYYVINTYASLMYELKKIGKVFMSNFVGPPGPCLIKKEFTEPRSHRGWETLDYGTVGNLRLHAPTHSHNIRPKCNTPLKFTARKCNNYMHVKCRKYSTQLNITTYLTLDRTVHLAPVYTWQWLAPSVLEDKH
jgi:hypothetical protein